MKLQEAVIYYVSGKVFIGRVGDLKKTKEWYGTLGACKTGWSDMSDEDAFKALTWLAFEVIEFAQVPIRMMRDQLEDRVDGYRDYSQRIAKMALQRDPLN